MDNVDAREQLHEIYTADRLAKLVVDHITNENGEIMARVWENPGFQEVYDYKGVNQKRRRMKRKIEQVYNQLDANKQLFQKTYYNPQLLQEDEEVLRSTFLQYSQSHDTRDSVLQALAFVAYWPATYWVSKRVKPFGVLLFTGVYYFGFYRAGLLTLSKNALQSGLNSAARPIAEKYGILNTSKYLGNSE